MGLLTDTQDCGLRMRRECWERFPRHCGVVPGLHLMSVVALNIIPDRRFIADTMNGLKFSMLLYPDHLQNWLDFGYGLLIFFILVAFWFSETGHICGFQ